MILSAALLPGGKAGAQAEDTSLNLTTSPLPLNLRANPGENRETELRIKNSGTRNEQLQITLFKFAAFGEEGQPRIIEREPGDDYFDWVTFSQREFTAEPNVWNNIKMNIDVPPTAGLGYYYAVVFSRAGTDPTNPAGTGLQGGTATLVLLDVKSDNAKKQIEVAEFYSKKRVYEFLPAEFTFKLRNSGNIHLAPGGTMFITQGGKEIGTVDLNKERGNILPQSNRIFNVKWEDGFPLYKDKLENNKVVTDKNGNPVRELTWDLGNFTKFRFGKYSATLLMAYDDGQRDVPIEATVSFWVIPWRILGVILLIVLFVGIGLWTIGRKAYRGTRKLVGKKDAAVKKDDTPKQG